MGVRLSQLEESALAIARFFSEQPEVHAVLHPALASCPGHAIWSRDFTGSASVFSVVFVERISREAIVGFIQSLKLFRLGFGWGGVTSLVMRYDDLGRAASVPTERLVRFHVGLESVKDLIADLRTAWAALR